MNLNIEGNTESAQQAQDVSIWPSGSIFLLHAGSRDTYAERYLESPHNVLYLGILRVAQHLGNLSQTIPRLFARYDFLESPDAGSTLPFPIFGIRIESFKHVKCLQRVEEVPHLVAVVCNQLHAPTCMSTRTPNSRSELPNTKRNP
jgi:hypothetical protein